jgi:hypothetical protein
MWETDVLADVTRLHFRTKPTHVVTVGVTAGSDRGGPPDLIGMSGRPPYIPHIRPSPSLIRTRAALLQRQLGQDRAPDGRPEMHESPLFSGLSVNRGAGI